MGLLKSEIILAAQQNVSRGTELDAICDVRLNVILDELYENYTWEFLSKDPPATITFAAASQTWTLPADYLKFMVLMLVRSDLNAANPSNSPLHKIDYTQYQMLSNPLQQGTPALVAINKTFTDVGAPGAVAYVYPVPDKTYTGRLSYYYKPNFDIADSAEPTFPDSAMLVELLTNALLGMGYGNRELQREYDPELMEKIMGRHRRNQVDNGIYPQRARLDPRKFSSGIYGRSGASSPWSRD